MVSTRHRRLRVVAKTFRFLFSNSFFHPSFPCKYRLEKLMKHDGVGGTAAIF